MSLVPNDPFRQLANLRKDVDNFFSNFPSLFQSDLSTGGLRVDVHETDEEVVVTCDVPGIESKEDLDIQVDKQKITISGSVQRSNEVKEENMYRRERFVGRFHRAVALPTEVLTDDVKAKYRNGVLEVTMKKADKPSTPQIDIDFE